MIRRLASHGFAVIALCSFDMSRVGCSGHSMGGLESEQMLIKDSRVITAMLNNSGDLGHTAMSTVPAGKTVGIVYGEGGMAASVAWMRWHLGGEDFRKADFVGATGKCINGPIVGEQGNWKGQCKNF